MSAVTGISGIQLSAASAAYAPTNSADVSAIASAYAESAVSSKADSSALSSYVPYSSLEYNTASAISGINGSALAAGSTYSAGEGIDITDDVISVETPVDIVAGPGIVVDNPDGNTLRVSMAADYEVTLWENASGKSPNTSGAFPITLSEPISNFETVKFFWQTFNFAGNNHTVSEKMTDIADISLGDFIFNASTSKAYSILWELSVSGTTLSHVAAYYKGFDSNTTTGDAVAFVKLYKVVGIHRLANN